MKKRECENERCRDQVGHHERGEACRIIERSAGQDKSPNLDGHVATNQLVGFTPSARGYLQRVKVGPEPLKTGVHSAVRADHAELFLDLYDRGGGGSAVFGGRHGGRRRGVDKHESVAADREGELLQTRIASGDGCGIGRACIDLDSSSRALLGALCDVAWLPDCFDLILQGQDGATGQGIHRIDGS
jgi:hypothetical protein